ncbi:MAG: C4-dicarboxylate ABC transporter substrate-binding protein [Betaproteobacteria bacterium]|nr:MAG: C4-dicarboxylate ABC transporter substrate-binding protein [Betaproteobacteria bacterium]
MKRAFLQWISALAIVSSGLGSAQADTFRLSIGAGHPADAAVWITMIRDFFAPEVAKRVEQKTGHKIEWVSAYGGSVCKLGECLEAVESGLLDVADLQAPFEPIKMMAHNFAYFVPFGTPDPVLAARASRKVYDTVPGLRRVLETKYNQIFLGVGTVGNYSLVTTFAWDKVEQLKNRKIAAAGPNIPWLQAVGAIPVQSNLNEAYNAMQSGVYEGWVMFPDATVGFKLYEVAKNYTFTDFGAISTTVITINKDSWKKLPKAVQDIMLEVGKEYTEVESKAVAEKQRRSIDVMKTAGVNVRSLSDAEKVKWANALPDIPNQRSAEIRKAGQPGEAVGAYIKALKEGGAKLPRDWKIK